LYLQGQDLFAKKIIPRFRLGLPRSKLSLPPVIGVDLLLCFARGGSAGAAVYTSPFGGCASDFFGAYVIDKVKIFEKGVAVKKIIEEKDAIM